MKLLLEILVALALSLVAFAVALAAALGALQVVSSVRFWLEDRHHARLDREREERARRINGPGGGPPHHGGPFRPPPGD